MNSIKSIVAFFLLMPIFSYSASIGLVEELSFTIPKLNGKIFHMDFNDIDGDNIPEILACDSSLWVLYSIDKDSVIAFDSLQFPAAMSSPYANSSNVRILLDDIDGDFLDDVVVCVYRTEYDYYSEIPAVELRVYSGASHYQDFSSFFFESGDCYFDCGLRQMGVLKAIDLDNDDVKEIVVSFHVSNPSPWYEYTGGRTYIFNPFPDSIISSPTFIPSLHTIGDSQNSRILVEKFHYSESTRPSTNISYSERLGRFYSLYYFVGIPIQFFYTTPCNSTTNWGSFYIDWLCQGNINAQSSASDFLILSKSSNGCGSVKNLGLYNYVSIDSIPLIWNLPVTGRRLSEFVFLPQFPGYFFAFEDGIFTQFNGDDGSIFQQTATTPSGDREWAYPYNDSIPRLVVRNSTNVSFYRADISTPIYENEPETLPETFKLSAPYPNPFNPEVNFSLSIPTKTEITVKVFNIVGQQVGVIYRGITSAGELNLSWNAGRNPSGVYLIKASSAEQTATVKAVLLK